MPGHAKKQITTYIGWLILSLGGITAFGPAIGAAKIHDLNNALLEND
jgi:hypothetical protein